MIKIPYLKTWDVELHGSLIGFLELTPKAQCENAIISYGILIKYPPSIDKPSGYDT